LPGDPPLGLPAPVASGPSSGSTRVHGLVSWRPRERAHAGGTTGIGPAAGHGVTVSVALWRTPPAVAEIVLDVELLTVGVVIVKVPVVAPAGIVMDAGTVAALVLLLDRVTTVPDAGAVPVRVTVPIEDEPPRTDAGDRTSDEAAGGVTVNVADRVVVPPAMAEMAPEVDALTGTVVTVKVAVVAPAGTVTVAGTDAAALALDSLTTVPAGGAAMEMVTVPVEDGPPTTLVGLSLRDEAVTRRTESDAVLVVPA
jgi:hypothetical protein